MAEASRRGGATAAADSLAAAHLLEGYLGARDSATDRRGGRGWLRTGARRPLRRPRGPGRRRPRAAPPRTRRSEREKRRGKEEEQAEVAAPPPPTAPARGPRPAGAAAHRRRGLLGRGPRGAAGTGGAACATRGRSAAAPARHRETPAPPRGPRPPRPGRRRPRRPAPPPVPGRRRGRSALARPLVPRSRSSSHFHGDGSGRVVVHDPERRERQRSRRHPRREGRRLQLDPVPGPGDDRRQALRPLPGALRARLRTCPTAPRSNALDRAGEKGLDVHDPRGLQPRAGRAAGRGIGPRPAATWTPASAPSSWTPPKYGGKDAENLEGFLFPDTFELKPGAPAADLVQLQLQDFKRRIKGVDMSYAKSKNLTVYDVVTIASMVEAEAGTPAQRPAGRGGDLQPPEGRDDAGDRRDGPLRGRQLRQPADRIGAGDGLARTTPAPTRACRRDRSAIPAWPRSKRRRSPPRRTSSST